MIQNEAQTRKKDYNDVVAEISVNQIQKQMQ